ncbi:MAG: nuclear transport factor 2 family protein [Thermomicrobiales bacterium]
MSAPENAAVMRETFDALERRDARRLRDLFDPAIEFHWPRSLPYGGSGRERDWQGPTWGETWDPLQPTAEERRMDARIVAAGDEEVVVLWWQRGISPAGERCESPVLGLYEVHEGTLTRAQMFYFDTTAVATFLEHAASLMSAPEQAALTE